MLRVFYLSITFSLFIAMVSCSTYQVTEKVYQAELASVSFNLEQINKI